MANCTWVMWYLPWPASSPTSSLTASYYLIYCGLDDDSVLATHTHAHVHKPARVLKCSRSTWQLVFFLKKWSVGLLCFFFFILRNKNRDTCCESPQCVMMLSQRGRRPVLAVMWSHKRQIAFMTSTVLPTARAADRSIREGIYVTDRLQRGDSCPNDRQHCH